MANNYDTRGFFDKYARSGNQGTETNGAYSTSETKINGNQSFTTAGQTVVKSNESIIERTLISNQTVVGGNTTNTTTANNLTNAVLTRASNVTGNRTVVTGNTTGTVVNGQTSNIVGGQTTVVGGQTTVIGGNTVYGGQTVVSNQTYTTPVTDYRLVNQAYNTTTVNTNYQTLGQNLIQRAVAVEIPV